MSKPKPKPQPYTKDNPFIWKKHCDRSPCGWHLVAQDEGGVTVRECHQQGCPSPMTLVYREW